MRRTRRRARLVRQGDLHGIRRNHHLCHGLHGCLRLLHFRLRLLQLCRRLAQQQLVVGVHLPEPGADQRKHHCGQGKAQRETQSPVCTLACRCTTGLFALSLLRRFFRVNVVHKPLFHSWRWFHLGWGHAKQRAEGLHFGKLLLACLASTQMFFEPLPLFAVERVQCIQVEIF